MDAFYVTTPIYYVNDKPHIGHAYSTVAADVLARYARLRGASVRFLTGTDEHGQKIEDSAKARGIEPQAFVDQMSPPFRKCFEELSCSFDDYIRTTESRHKERVQALWKTMQDKGDIYLGEYEGWYSVADEAYITEKELEALDPVTRSKVKRMSEPSYFFKLSAYGDRLMKFYEDNPDFVRPPGRFNEVKAFVREGLHDISMSRTSFSWGVDVPGDPEHVMWVWCDALTNYISALGGPAEAGESPLFDEFWGRTSADGGNKRQVHIVGKDILRFHAIFWPAFLLSAGIDPPSQVWAHGWLTINGEKMSKRLHNFIPSGPLVEAFGPDVVRYYLSREVAFGQDGDFSHKNVLARYNGELANGLGNLLNRMIASIVKKNLDGKVPPRGGEEPVDVALREKAQDCAKRAREHLDNISPHRALDAIWELVGAANKYVDETAPWKLAKDGDTERLGHVAYNTLEALRWLSAMVAPFMPGKADGLRKQLGLPPLAPAAGMDQWPSEWGGLEPGTQTDPGEALFPRVDKKREKEILAGFGLDADGKPLRDDVEAEPPKTQKSTNSSRSTKKADAGYLKFEDFLKVELKVGEIKTAEALPKSDKLIKLQIDLGEPELRQVLAGIREHYKPEDMVGKRVVVVANLKPRKIMGVESQGMVLAAKDDENGLSVLTLEKPIDSGTRVT